VNIAYQVRGEGPAELVCVPQWINNLAIVWENPLYARSLKRLASFSRLVLWPVTGR